MIMADPHIPSTPSEHPATDFESFDDSEAPLIRQNSTASAKSETRQPKKPFWSRILGSRLAADAAQAVVKAGEPQAKANVVDGGERQDEAIEKLPAAAQPIDKSDKRVEPQPMPENLWGDSWQFIQLPAEEVEYRLLISPIPLRNVAPNALPSEQMIAPTDLIPGVVIEAGKQSIRLARWVQKQQPLSLRVLKRDRGVLTLNTDSHCWIMPTYSDKTVREAFKNFEALKLRSSGIHFLLIQPDFINMNYSGLWILRG
jgi:RNA-binding protein Tab2/Atab2